MQGNKISVTSQLCAWNRSRKSAEPALLENINFKRPKKGQLPSADNVNTDACAHYSVR